MQILSDTTTITLISPKLGIHTLVFDTEDLNGILKGWKFYVWKTKRHAVAYVMGYSPDDKRKPKKFIGL